MSPSKSTPDLKTEAKPNVRLALVLLSVAVVFFAGVIVKFIFFPIE